MTYEIYGSASCGYCTQAKALLEARDLEYNYFDLADVSGDMQTELMNIAGHQFRTVPQIFIEQHDERFDNERVRKRIYVGGFTELSESLKGQEKGMKYYLLEPKEKKSVVEYQTFSKEINESKIYAIREEGYRGGSWIIHVPETDEEIDLRLEELDMTRDDIVAYYGEDINSMGEKFFLPDPDEDYHELNDYDFEMIQMYDGCWADWKIVATLDTMCEEDQDDLLVKVEELWAEDYDFALTDDGWSDDGTTTEVQCEILLRECDESGYVEGDETTGY